MHEGAVTVWAAEPKPAEEPAPERSVDRKGDYGRGENQQTPPVAAVIHQRVDKEDRREDGGDAATHGEQQGRRSQALPTPHVREAKQLLSLIHI